MPRVLLVKKCSDCVYYESPFPLCGARYSCSHPKWKGKGKTIARASEGIPKEDFPDWCPLEEYKTP
jgi:hypothetical protein